MKRKREEDNFLKKREENMGIQGRRRLSTHGMERFIRICTRGNKRTIIAVLLFALFVAMDYSGEKVATVDSKRVVREIQAEMGD